MMWMSITVWSLRQSHPDELLPPGRPIPRTALIRIARPSVDLGRFLYWTIGQEWGWRSRHAWSDGTWRAALHGPCVETWMSWHYGQPTGYAEIVTGLGDRRDTARIKYLGLLPDFHGVGLGGQLLWDVARRAWTAHRRNPALPPVAQVVLDTTSLDSPHALPNYYGRGFRLWREAEVEREASSTSRST